MEQNPWQTAGSVPEALARSAERPLGRSLWERLLHNEPPRFQVIMGPRRVGKSTAMYQTVRRLLAAGAPPSRVWWLRVDHPLLMRIPLGSLVRSILSRAAGRDPVYLFLDEITYAQEWDLWLKTFYDERWPVVVTGSSSATTALRERRLESGVGRWEEQYLSPYLFPEYLELIGRTVSVPIANTLSESIDACIATGPASTALAGLAEERRRFLLTGGFPELLVAMGEKPADEASLLLESQRTLRSDAVVRAIYKDIPQTFGVDNPLMLERLLYTLAGQVTGILSPSSICQSLGGLSQPTLERHLSYLQRAYLVFALPNYAAAEETRQRRGRKLYFIDSAVRNAALQRGLGPLGDAIEMGLLVENMVASHLHALSQHSQVRLYHWHDRGQEVDLVYDHPEQPLAFEVGMSASHRRHALHAFAERFPRFRQRCFLVAPDALLVAPTHSADGIGRLPLDLLLLVLGAQADRELALRLGAARGAVRDDGQRRQ